MTDPATDWRAEQERRIYQAAGIGDAEQVEKWTANIVQWLAGWDDHTVRGVEALLSAARHPAADDNVTNIDPFQTIARLDEIDRDDVIEPLKQADEQLSYLLPFVVRSETQEAQRLADALLNVRVAVSNLEACITSHQRQQVS